MLATVITTNLSHLHLPTSSQVGSLIQTLKLGGKEIMITTSNSCSIEQKGLKNLLAKRCGSLQALLNNH